MKIELTQQTFSKRFEYLNHSFRRNYQNKTNINYDQICNRNSSGNSSKTNSTSIRRNYNVGLRATPIFSENSNQNNISIPRKIKLNLSNNSNSSSVTSLRNVLTYNKNPNSEISMRKNNSSNSKSKNSQIFDNKNCQILEQSALEEYSIHNNVSLKNAQIIDENNPKSERIYVQEAKRGLMEFFVSPFDTVSNLKQQISKKLGVKVYKINLYKDGKN